MTTIRVARRLSAILAADVVGYSRLMERDEAGTFGRLKRLRKELIEPVLARYGGRFVDLKGDGAIVEFGSVAAAVEAAVEIQRAMLDQDPDLPEGERIRYRIGINLGDVIVDGDTIYGDGVNVAARIESLCEPGGVWLSRSVYNQVRGKLDLALVPSGLHQVKNISEAVETFRVALDGVAPAAPRPTVARPRARRWAQFAASALLVLVFSMGAWLFWPGGQTAKERPGIAVLPFDNLGADEAMDRLAAGVTEDIITDLARFRGLDVIARNSTAVYKGKPVDVRQIGRDLDVNYVLEGSIQRQANRIRITAQLINAESGAHIWSDRWDRPLQDVFAIQTEAAEEVAAALGGNLTMGQITRNELQRAKRMRPTELKAYDYFLLGQEAKSTVSKDSIPRGLDYLNKSIALEPNLARAYSVRAWMHYFSMMFGADQTTMRASMSADAETAVQIDQQDAEALASLAYIRVLQGRYAEAEAQFRLAIDMNPANSHVLILAASGLAFLGKAEEGAVFGDLALRLDPRMTPANRAGVKDAYYMAHRYEDTIAIVSPVPLESRTRDSWLFLAGSYVRMGMKKEAADTKADLLEAFQSVSAERMLNEDYAFARKEDEDFFIDTFRVLEMPVCMSAVDVKQTAATYLLPVCQEARGEAISAGP